MKFQRPILLIVLFGGLTLALLYLFFSDKDKSYNWYESFSGKSNEPYGLSFLRQLLEANQKGGTFKVHDKKPLHEFLKDENIREKTNYVFIGSAIYLNSDDKEAIKDFISDGNTAFIATHSVPDFVADIYDAECGILMHYNENSQGAAVLNLYHPSFYAKYGYKYLFRVEQRNRNYNWRSLDNSLFCDSTKQLVPLGYLEPEKVNFVRMKYGKGTLYLHTNPIVFTNYYLTKNDQAKYASAVFSHLDGKHIIWDEFEKIPFVPDDNSPSNNPLYFIMQQPSLKYSWWILVASVILYVAFASKRKQRIIPIREEKTNTSLEFMRLVSALHYQEKNHLDMARKKMKYFQYFVRSKYGIHITAQSENIILKIAEKSTVPVDDVRAIFNLNKLIEEGSGGVIEAPRLSNFYYAIEKFYKQCK